MSSLFRLRTALSVVALAALTLPACIVNLTDRNAPEDKGGVTGAPADCSAITVVPNGAPLGDVAPKFVGRFAFLEDDDGAPTGEALFDWSGSSVTLRFEGTSQVTVKLLVPGAIPQDQMFEFVVDGAHETRRITVKNDAAGQPTNEPETEYVVGGLDPSTPHEVTIYKNTEAQKGPVLWKGFDLHGGTLLQPTRRPRRMEFIGDSITCGYGNEGKHATCPFEVTVREVQADDGTTVPVTVPVTENQYKAFTAIAARALDADAVTTCWSGKGVYKNYKERVVLDPETGALVPAADDATTIPALWDARTLASDAEGFAWDWSKERPEEVPQVVVISLGTNDFARDTQPPATEPDALPGDNVPDGDLNDPAELEQFFLHYLELVRKVRERRPDAHIFVATPPMVTDQFPLEKARTRLRAVLGRITAAQAAVGDTKVYAMNLVEQGFRYGLGCDYHPNLEVHRVMAKQLVDAVRSKTCW